MREPGVTRNTIYLIVFAMILGLVTGCAPKAKYEDLKAFAQAHKHDVMVTSYRIEPPDVVRIASPVSPEVNGVYKVGGDGKIMIKLLGSVKVATLTAQELAAKLERLLDTYYVDPKVEVSVVEFASKKIYVFGQVNGPGPKPFTGRDTLLNVLAENHPNFIAWGSQVKVIRPSPFPDEVHEIVVDVNKMMQTGDLRSNLLLQEGDVVYVPPTPLGWLGLRAQEVLFPLAPLMAGYTYPANVYGATRVYGDLQNRAMYNTSYGYGGGMGNPGW